MSTNIENINEIVVRGLENIVPTTLKGLTTKLQEHKKLAIEALHTNGLPANKSEKYKYAQIPSILKKHFNAPLIISERHTGKDFRCDVTHLDAVDLYLVNGTFQRPFFNDIARIGSFFAGSLVEGASAYPQIFNEHFSKITGSNEEGLLAMNSLLYNDGIFIYIPDGVKMTRPIQIISVVNDERTISTAVRHLIVIGKKSSADIIICDHSMKDQNYLISSAAEIFVGESAHLNITHLQNMHEQTSRFSHTFINIADNAVANHHSLVLNAGFTRSNLEANLNGLHAKMNCYGLAITANQQYVDHYVLLNHLKPNGESTQLYKGLLDGHSELSFNGKILVAKDAQKTNAYQSNRNLLLSNEAKANTKPQLEIYADDVKCSHGATFGKVDENALYYLKSRGIGKDEAQTLLMFAFADEVLQTISSHPLRERMESLVNERIRGHKNSCKCGTL